MEIYFCDLCNESVPQGDLERGRARMENGRVICQACEAAMSPEGEGPEGPAKGAAASAGDKPPTQAPAAPGATPAPAAAPGGGATGTVAVLLGSLALVTACALAAGLFAVFDARLRDLEGQLSESESGRREDRLRLAQEWRRDLQELDARVGILTERTEAARDERGGLGERLETLADLRGQLQGLEERLQGQLDAQDERALQKSELQAGDLDLLTDRLRDLEAEFLRLAGRLDAGPAVAATAEPAVASEPAGEEAPSWMGLVADLKSQNSGERWQAVQELGSTRDARVAPHLAPMLKDPDIFVRMATARILGDLGALVAVPSLIDALEDPEASVREAAVVSLRSLTDQDFRFNPGGKEADRAKRVKAWREWWSREADDLLGR